MKEGKKNFNRDVTHCGTVGCEHYGVRRRWQSAFKYVIFQEKAKESAFFGKENA